MAFLLTVTDDPFTQDNCGQTPIHLAALNGHFNIVRMLLEHLLQNFANNSGHFAEILDAKDFSGETPLYIGKISHKL